jgi:threonine dehydrogenase-like Zn-dependent dehydrogenase
VDPSADDARARILAATGGAGPDIAINTSARSAGLQLGIDVLPREGVAVEASWYGDTPTELDLGASFHRRRITIRASQVSHLNPVTEPRWSRARRTELVWRLVREIRPSALITHRFPLDAAAQAYELIRERPQEVLQVVLVP